MSDTVITVDSLSKAYCIGRQRRHGKTFREAMLAGAAAPFRRLSSIANGGSGTAAEEETFWALRDVSFEVKRGEVVGIIGRNGAGKSTLLKILSRITEPTSGSIRLRGRVASLLEVGTGFHPELTGRENIYLNGAILGMRRAEIARKFDEIVAFAEVEKFLDTQVKRYSSGMYVRLAFAVAAHLEPEILIVDEVLAVGDAEFQKKCLGKMQQVSQGEGRTVLFVSHNMAAVRSLCANACLIENGQLRLKDSAERCVQLYMSGETDALPCTFSFARPSGAPQWMEGARISVNGQPSSAAFMGDTLSIEVDFKAERPLERPRLGITLYASDGTCLFHTGNRYQRAAAYESPRLEGTIACDFGKLPLVAGRYQITLWFGDLSSDSHIADKAVAFDVVEKDIWGFGRVPPARDSYLWWPTRFQLLGRAEPKQHFSEEILSL